MPAISRVDDVGLDQAEIRLIGSRIILFAGDNPAFAFAPGAGLIIDFPNDPSGFAGSRVPGDLFDFAVFNQLSGRSLVRRQAGHIFDAAGFGQLDEKL